MNNLGFFSVFRSYKQFEIPLSLQPYFVMQSILISLYFVHILHKFTGNILYLITFVL